MASLSLGARSHGGDLIRLHLGEQQLHPGSSKADLVEGEAGGASKANLVEADGSGRPLSLSKQDDAMADFHSSGQELRADPGAAVRGEAVVRAACSDGGGTHSGRSRPN